MMPIIASRIRSGPSARQEIFTMGHNPPAILFLSGASGVGKTTLVSFLERRARSGSTVFLHSDSAGVPSFQEMIREAGCLEKWQERRIHWWIKRIASEY